MKTVAAALLAAVCLIACRQRQERTDSGVPPGDGTLTIATYNVLYSLAGKSGADGDTLRHIQSVDADVFLFQETNEAWERALRAVLAKRFPHCAFHPPERHVPGGLGACAKSEIVTDELLVSPVGWFPAQRLHVRTPAGEVQVLNVHLAPAVASPETWRGVQMQTRPLRRQEIQAYIARLTKGRPTIIAGDFNELPEGDVFDTLSVVGFDSALPRARETGVTWHWQGLRPAVEAQLDHVAYEASAFELVSARIVRGGNSDHDPVVVGLRKR